MIEREDKAAMNERQNSLNKSADHRLRGLVTAIAGALCWGFSGTCCQYLFQGYTIDTIWLAAVRLVAGGLVLLAMELIHKKGHILKPLKSVRSAGEILLIGVFGLLFCQYAYLAAIRYSDSGTATILQSVNVIMILAVSCIAAKKLPVKKQVAAIIAAMAGVWLIVTGGNLSTMSVSPKGLFWGLGAAVGAAVYSLLSPHAVKKWGSQAVSGYGMLAGGLILTVCTGVWKNTPVLDLKAVALLTVVVLVGTVGGFALFLQGISDLGPQKASLIGCLEPVAAAVSAYLWLGTIFGVATLAGFALVLAAVVLSNR